MILFCHSSLLEPSDAQAIRSFAFCTMLALASFGAYSSSPNVNWFVAVLFFSGLFRTICPIRLHSKHQSFSGSLQEFFQRPGRFCKQKEPGPDRSSGKFKFTDIAFCAQYVVCPPIVITCAWIWLPRILSTGLIRKRYSVRLGLRHTLASYFLLISITPV